MKTITTELKTYLVTSRAGKGVSYWIDEKEFNTGSKFNGAARKAAGF